MHIIGPFLVGLLMMFLSLWLLTSDINFELNSTLRSIIVIVLAAISIAFWVEAFNGKRDRIRRQ